MIKTTPESSALNPFQKTGINPLYAKPKRLKLPSDSHTREMLRRGDKFHDDYEESTHRRI